MKTFLLFTCLLGTLLTAYKPLSPEPWAGVWRQSLPGGGQFVLLCGENYAMAAAYTDSTYIGTWGGKLKATPAGAELLLEFCPSDTAQIGQVFQLSFQQGQLTLQGKLPYAAGAFHRLAPETGPLTGQWRITERANPEGKLLPMDPTAARKTLKLLVGNRFQWAAINPATHEFFGTGGGVYNLQNGRYTETIAFFSRDNRRVGASLPFAATVQGNRWEQRGQSSSGQAIHEVWIRQ